MGVGGGGTDEGEDDDGLEACHGHGAGGRFTEESGLYRGLVRSMEWGEVFLYQSGIRRGGRELHMK